MPTRHPAARIASLGATLLVTFLAGCSAPSGTKPEPQPIRWNASASTESELGVSTWQLSGSSTHPTLEGEDGSGNSVIEVDVAQEGGRLELQTAGGASYTVGPGEVPENVLESAHALRRAAQDYSQDDASAPGGAGESLAPLGVRPLSGNSGVSLVAPGSTSLLADGVCAPLVVSNLGSIADAVDACNDTEVITPGDTWSIASIPADPTQCANAQLAASPQTGACPDPNDVELIKEQISAYQASLSENAGIGDAVLAGVCKAAIVATKAGGAVVGYLACEVGSALVGAGAGSVVPVAGTAAGAGAAALAANPTCILLGGGLGVAAVTLATQPVPACNSSLSVPDAPNGSNGASGPAQTPEQAFPRSGANSNAVRSLLNRLIQGSSQAKNNSNAQCYYAQWSEKNSWRYRLYYWDSRTPGTPSVYAKGFRELFQLAVTEYLPLRGVNGERYSPIDATDILRASGFTQKAVDPNDPEDLYDPYCDYLVSLVFSPDGVSHAPALLVPFP
jgi:hypothetical protein